MGNCAELFYNSADSSAQTLSHRISPTKDQFEDQQERWNALADYLVQYLRERTSYPISTWLQGSYKFGTQIRPTRSGTEFDIDLGVYFAWSGADADGRFGPQQLKTIVQSCLKAYDGEDVIEAVTPPKTRCCRIRFVGDFHIDIPAYHLDVDDDRRALATEQNDWEDSDPKALYLWFKNRFDDEVRAKVRRQIRYLKCYAGLRFANDESRPSSTLLTVLVAEACAEFTPEAFDADDDCLYEILNALVERLEEDAVVPDPINGDNLNFQSDSPEADALIEGLISFKGLAREALAAENEVEACDKWSNAFEHFFPLPPDDHAKAVETGSMHLPVRVILPEIEVRAVSRANRNLAWTGRNEISGIPKNCDIYFNITNRSSIPLGVEIMWMVRNEGDEAENINDLGHRAGTGFTATERSAYSGRHYMDCILRQYGRVIALRRVPVTITGAQVPRRNPLRRPSYVKLRGTR